MKIYDLIREDHDNIRDHLARLDDVSEANPRSRRQIFRLLREDLAQHMRIEEEVVYTTLESHPQFSERIGQSRVEHGEFESLLERLDKLEPESSKWSDRFSELKEALERHLEDEETELFDRMRSQISEEQAFWMAEAMNDRKARYRSAAA